MKHHTNSERSERLQPIITRLLDGKPHTNFELRQLNNSAALHSDIDDLRSDGYIIECTYAGLSENRRRIHNYQLTGQEGNNGEFIPVHQLPGNYDPINLAA